MPYPYITQAELEARISPTALRRLLDDSDRGEPDSDAVESLIRDSSAKVAGYLRGIYNLEAVATDTPSEVKRLTLDVAVAMGAQRHPEVVRYDWEPLMKSAVADLTALRMGKTRLDVKGSPEPAANNGGELLTGNPDCPVPPPLFSANWGSF